LFVFTWQPGGHRLLARFGGFAPIAAISHATYSLHVPNAERGVVIFIVKMNGLLEMG
jgi:hypothetical protein